MQGLDKNQLMRFRNDLGISGKQEEVAETDVGGIPGTLTIKKKTVET